MNNTMFNFSACLDQTFDSYKKHFLLLVGASLISSILISVTAGILTGPILAGLITLILKLMDEDDSATFEDIFSRFDTFTTTFLLCLVWGLVLYIAIVTLMMAPIIGQLASILLSIGFSVFITFAVMLAADKGMDFSQASCTAFDMLKKDLWPLIGFAALASILSSIGAIACGIGIIFTMPMLYVMLAAAYRNCSAQIPAEEITLEPAPPPAEPVELIEEAVEPITETPAEPVDEESETPDEPKPE